MYKPEVKLYYLTQLFTQPIL